MREKVARARHTPGDPRRARIARRGAHPGGRANRPFRARLLVGQGIRGKRRGDEEGGRLCGRVVVGGGKGAGPQRVSAREEGRGGVVSPSVKKIRLDSHTRVRRWVLLRARVWRGVLEAGPSRRNTSVTSLPPPPSHRLGRQTSALPAARKGPSRARGSLGLARRASAPLRTCAMCVSRRPGLLERGDGVLRMVNASVGARAWADFEGNGGAIKLPTLAAHLD